MDKLTIQGTRASQFQPFKALETSKISLKGCPWPKLPKPQFLPSIIFCNPNYPLYNKPAL